MSNLIRQMRIRSSDIHPPMRDIPAPPNSPAPPVGKLNGIPLYHGVYRQGSGQFRLPNHTEVNVPPEEMPEVQIDGVPPVNARRELRRNET